MAQVFDVADFFIRLAQTNENDTITNLRLNKLLFLAQGWYLAKYDEALFQEEIEAWDFGPVIPSIYKKYKENGKNNIDHVSEGYTPDVFTGKELNILMDVFNSYKDVSTTGLVNITHRQGSPWDSVYRKGENDTISKESIRDYYRKRQELQSFHIPGWMRETAIDAKRTDTGYIVLPAEWGDDDA